MTHAHNIPPKPVALKVIPEPIPAELKALDQWLIWRYFWKAELGHFDKPPLDANKSGNAGKSTDPKTWASFEKVFSSYQLGHYDGIGIAITQKNGVVAFDLDGCRDPVTGIIAEWALAIVRRLRTYWEISPSGTGLRGFGYGCKPGSRCRSGDFEMYSDGRYVCVTGHHLEGTPTTIEPVQEGIDAVYAQMFPAQDTSPSSNGSSPHAEDTEIIAALRRFANGAKFCRLFDHGDISDYGGDDSVADLGLCRLIAFRTQNPEQIDRIFRTSALNRSKWEDRADYRERTIAKAIAHAYERYQGVCEGSDNGQPEDQVSDQEPETSPPSSTTLAQVEEVFRRWLGLPDIGLLHVQLGTIAGNLLPDADPVWLMEIGGSGWGKTENLQSTSGLPFVHLAATLTESSLLSGTPLKDKAKGTKGGLLRDIGSFGILVLKDFTSILSMHRDARAAVLAALREIYDGRWTRHVGVDGGRKLDWAGKIGVIAGVTSTIDRHHAVISTMGERFIFYRLQKPDEEKQAQQGLKNVGKEKTMRAELADVVKALFASIAVPTTAATLSSSEERQLIAWARLAARCRSPIERDSYSREIELIPDPEAPVRLAQILLRLFTGMLAIGVPRDQAWKHLRKIIFDCMPAIRYKVLQFLLYSHEPARSTTDIATGLGYPTETARRALEDLTAHEILTRTSQGKGKPDLWKLSALATQLIDPVP
jgi:hypothetical protein